VHQQLKVTKHEFEKCNSCEQNPFGSITKQTAKKAENDANLCSCHDITKATIEAVKASKGACAGPQNSDN
jgi:hypothetical protein